MLPLLYLCWLGVRHTVQRVTIEEPEDMLFTEIDRARPPAIRRRTMSAAGPEVLLAAGYALFLLAAALGLDLLARHSQRALGPLPHGGLQLPPPPRRLGVPGGPAPAARRARRPAARRALPGAGARLQRLPGEGATAPTPTTGREVVRPLDPWPHSEAGRFHRGISVALACLAGVIATIALVRHHGFADAVALGVALAATAAALPRLAGAFQRAPANFPGTPGPG